MSDKEYIKMYEYLNDNQRDAMADLWMTGINQDGKVVVNYSEVEKTVAKLIKEWVKNK